MAVLKTMGRDSASAAPRSLRPLVNDRSGNGALRQAPALRTLRFTTEGYHRLVDIGVLGEDDRTELLNGEVVYAPRYAAAGIPELWIVDLAGEALEVYRDPDPAGYRRYRRHVRGETVISGSLPALSLTVDEILGPAAPGETALDEAAPDASAGQD